MIRVRQVKVPILGDRKILIQKTANKLNINPKDIIDIKINKQSLDARKKNEIHYVYEVDVCVNDEDRILRINKNNDVIKMPSERFSFNVTGTKKLKNRIVIVGAGPAGLFAAYMLAENGFNPLIIERGDYIEKRVKIVDEFWKTGNLDCNCNVQFGEGGAGTFSDGKLNTLVKDKEFIKKRVFEIFVENGAPENIMYLNKPHIGTDLLRNVIIKMRNKIICMGGEFRYRTCLTDIITNDSSLEAIEVNGEEIIPCNNLILAIGHSARDTFEMLLRRNLTMKSKPFAVGIRIQHPQDMINVSQYGSNDLGLPAAEYKLTYTTPNKRGVYSFCMCPGGYVVNASSLKNHLAINGMSNYARDSKNANSAIVVSVSSKDFGNEPLDGVKFQQKLEAIAFQKGNGKIPIQLFGDFKEKKVSDKFKDVSPIFKGEYCFADINEIFPSYICEALTLGIQNFDKKIKGYAREDAILAAVESRTSSPVKIERDELFESNIKGIYPCGEGAGYAGGITTSAMDGIKVARIIASIYRN